MEAFVVLLALGLGVKHAFDVDHLVAVGNVLTRAGSVPQAMRLSLWWSLGHLVTAGLLSLLLYYGRETFWPGIAARLEILVPLMLVVIGVAGLLLAFRRLHAHTHEHGGRPHAHVHVHLNERHEARKMGTIGLVHGLASNDELLLILLVVLGATTAWAVLGLVVLFGLGVVLGMSLYAFAMQATVSDARRPAAAWWANVVLSGLSILYAVYLFAGGKGWNLLALP